LIINISAMLAAITIVIYAKNKNGFFYSIFVAALLMLFFINAGTNQDAPNSDPIHVYSSLVLGLPILYAVSIIAFIIAKRFKNIFTYLFTYVMVVLTIFFIILLANN
jgi:hypothetical protein